MSFPDEFAKIESKKKQKEGIRYCGSFAIIFKILRYTGWIALVATTKYRLQRDKNFYAPNCLL